MRIKSLMKLINNNNYYSWRTILSKTVFLIHVQKHAPFFIKMSCTTKNMLMTETLDLVKCLLDNFWKMKPNKLDLSGGFTIS